MRLVRNFGLVVLCHLFLLMGEYAADDPTSFTIITSPPEHTTTTPSTTTTEQLTKLTTEKSTTTTTTTTTTPRLTTIFPTESTTTTIAPPTTIKTTLPETEPTTKKTASTTPLPPTEATTKSTTTELTTESIKIPTTESTETSTTESTETSTTKSTQIPTTDTTQIPTTDTAQLPTTDTTQIPSIDTTQLPTTDTTQIPTTDTTQLPTTDTTQIPTTDTTQLPTTDTTQLPTTDSTQLPTTDSTQLPTTDSTQLPTTDSTQIPSTESTKIPTTKSTTKAPFPDPKSRIPVIIQEGAKWLPELGKILAGSSSLNSTQLRDIYNYIQGLKKLKSTPDSVQDFIQGLENTDLFDELKRTQSPNVTQIPTTPDPYTNWWDVCAGDIEITLNAIMSREKWALKMFDASGKPSHSILEGNRKFFGNYKECVGTESGPQENRSRIEGNICRLAFDLDIDENILSESARIEWDLCLPKSCEGSDLSLLANQTLGSMKEISSIRVICTEDLDLYQDTGAISAICLLALLSVLVIVGTLQDVVLAVEAEGEENYVINAYDLNTPKMSSLNEGFELRETSIKDRPRMPRPTSRIDELKGALDMELQHISSNGRGPSIHGGIGRPVMGFAGVSKKPQYESDETPSTPTDNGHASNSFIVNPGFMPGEDAIGNSDTGSVHEFTPGGKEGTEDVDEKKKDVTDSLPRWKQLLAAFSIPRNMKRILGVKPSPGSIRCIHGVKVLSMGWIILGHTYDSILKTFQNPAVSKGLISTVRGQIIYNATFAVDTFFLISGLLTAYQIMKECGRSKKVPAKTGIMYYVHRFWRLTPPYILWIMVTATLLQYVGDGRPAWRDYNMADKCRDNWWTNLLYINNVYKNKEMCLTHSWYLANDMQFHIVAPLALIPWICGLRVIGFLVSGMMVALHVTSNIWLQLDLKGVDLTRNRQDYIYDIFVQPYARIAPYAFGLMMGWCLWKCKSKLHMNKYAAIAGWLVCLCGIGTLTFVTYDKNEDLQVNDNNWTTNGIAVFETLSRPLWGLFVAWIVVACATGNGGVINSFLSWGGWLPLSRLTYCVYIVHATVISFEEAAVESVMFFTETLMVYRFFGFLVMSFLVGLVLSLVAESPLIAVERALMPRKEI